MFENRNPPQQSITQIARWMNDHHEMIDAYFACISFSYFKEKSAPADFLSELAEAEEISTNELMKIIIQEFRKALTHIA